MKNTQTLALALALTFFAAVTLSAQHRADSTSRIGLVGGVGYSMHSSSFVNLPGMQSCCPEYTSASGFGPYFGLFYRLPLSSNWKLSLRAGYAGTSGTFTVDEFIGYALEGSGDNARVVEGTSQHELNTSFSSIEILPRIEFYPSEDLGFGLHAVIDAAIPLSGTYDSKETLISPSNAVYSDSRSKIRNVTSGDITNLSGFMMSAGIGAHWDFQMSDNWWLTPELTYLYGFSQVADVSDQGADASWKVSSLRLGLAIAYAMTSTTSTTTTGTRMKLSASVESKELKADNTEADIATIRVEETLSTQLYPLLPYVFFDNGVSNINTNTYRNLTPAQTRSFSEERDFTFDNTSADSRAMVTMDVYRNMLNVIGKRMRDKHPNARITVTGCNSDRDADRGNDKLSAERAENVMSYLTSVWGIRPERINVQGRGLPDKASKYTTTDSRDMQDATTVVKNNQPDAVVVNDTLREMTPPRLRFRLGAVSDTSLASWQFSAIHPLTPAQVSSGSAFLREEGVGAPPAYLVWARTASQKEIPKSSDPVTSAFSVTDAKGESITARDTMNVDLMTIERKKRERVGNYEVDRFRLALFEYEETMLSEIHARIVNAYIKPSLQPGAIVEIDGYTDRKGATTLNQKLSNDRATAVKEALGVSSATITAHGEGGPNDVAPYDNTTPEGRLYNRTVDVTVKIPAR